MDVREWLGEDNQIGIDIWEKKYRYNNESFDEWLDRVSGCNEEYKQLIIEKKFLPAGRILSNRGLYKNGVKVTYSNCYVQSPPDDNIESIFDCAKGLARTFSYGGGVGIDISKLAPRGAKVNNTAKETSGAVSFMELYSMITGLIGQNGRRGALMISLDCNHPDLEEFIELKTDLNKVTKANISVKITDSFMEAVKNDGNYKLSFIRKETGEVIEKTVNAREMFKKLCKANWDVAEPGMLFWDKITNWNLLSNNKEFEYAGVNPCAEEPLPAGGSCLLGSINLAEFVNDDTSFNFDEFKKVVRISVKFLNEILDEGLELHPLDIQRKTVNDWKQIGLGILGLADMLIKMEIVYGSPESIKICDEIGKAMINEAVTSSAQLAKEKGTYPKYNKEVTSTEFYQYNIEPNNLADTYGLRNSQLLTCAPTGTISTMISVSGGLEPIFANYYTRKTESLHGEDVYYKVYTPIVDKYMKEHNITNDKDLPPWFITSSQISYKDRIEMQAVWQSHIDASISSTINLPKESTIEDVENIYMLAHEKGLKGVTIYRSGCQREGILVSDDKSINNDNKDENSIEKRDFINEIDTLPRGYVVDVSDDLIGYKRKISTGCGSVHLEVYSDDITGEPQETFINIGSSGGCERNYQFISRLISTALRGGIPIESIIDQAMSIRPCNAYVNRTKTKGDTSPGTSCPSAIGYALKDLNEKMHDRCFVEYEECDTEDEYDVIKCNKIESETPGMKCPECGSKLQFEGGCIICKGDKTHIGCGWSKCD